MNNLNQINQEPTEHNETNNIKNFDDIINDIHANLDEKQSVIVTAKTHEINDIINEIIKTKMSKFDAVQYIIDMMNNHENKHNIMNAANYAASNKLIDMNFFMYELQKNKFILETGLPHIPTNSPDFVKTWYAHKNYSVDGTGIIFDNNAIQSNEYGEQKYLTIKNVYEEMNNIRKTYNDLFCKKFSQKDLEDSNVEYVNSEKKLIRKNLIKNFMDDINNDKTAPIADDSLWNEMLDHVFSTDPTPNDIKKLAIREFFWNVQHAALENLYVKNPLMIVMYGHQGAGKSRFIDWLLKPLNGLHTNAPLTTYTDSRTVDLRSDNLVLNIAEMAGADKADISSLKNYMDGGYTSTRQLGGHNSITGHSRAQLIGSSNTDISEVVRDSTGNRRFFQLELGDHGINIDYSQWDVMDFWRSVRYDDGEPFELQHELKKQFDGLQKQQKYNDPYELWFSDCVENEQYMDESSCATYDDMYENFKIFVESKCETSAKFVNDFAKFKNHMKQNAKNNGYVIDNKFGKDRATHKSIRRYYFKQK